MGGDGRCSAPFLCKRKIFWQYEKKLPPYNKSWNGIWTGANRQLLELKRECESYQVLDGPGALGISLMNLQGELETFLEELAEGQLGKTFPNSIFRFGPF